MTAVANKSDDRRQIDPILAEFFANTTVPSQAQLDFLTKRCGVPPTALGRDADGSGYVVAAADIELDGENLFDFTDDEASEGQSALIIVARDAGGDPLDLVGWMPRVGQTASRFGRSPILGEHTLGDVGLGEPVHVHRTIIDWLRAGRGGLVVVDPQRAGRLLVDAPDRLVAADRDHAAEIANMMTAAAGLDRIVVPTRRAA